MCSSLTVTNNRFESAGHAPSAGMKQQRRDDGIHTANQWVRLFLLLLAIRG